MVVVLTTLLGGECAAQTAPPASAEGKPGEIGYCADEHEDGGRRESKQGAVPAAGKKILYGKRDPELKSVVGIGFGGGAVCTGVIIADNALLTAGHCSCGSKPSYRLYFGQTFDDATNAKTVIPVTDVISFDNGTERYNCADPSKPQQGVDYAVITFDPSRLGPPEARKELYGLAAVMTPSKARESPLRWGGKLKVGGYGLTEKKKAGERRSVFVGVSSWDCAETWSKRHGCRAFAELTLSNGAVASALPAERYADSCSGDSGGPAFAVTLTAGENNVMCEMHHLVGITSRGMNVRQLEKDLPCGGGGVYEVVARKSVLSWLERLGINVRLESPESD